MRAVMTVIYKPLGVTMGIIAGLLSTRLFNFLWGKFDEEDPPKANTQAANWPKLLSAAAVQGIVFKVVRVVVDRGTAKSFHHLTGVWPGERAPDPKP